MPADVNVRVVAFDLMDTVLTDPYRDALRAATGREPAELFAMRDPDVYPAFERGEICEDDYWQHYHRLGLTVDRVVFHRVRRSGLGYLEGMGQVLDDLADKVVRVTASNYPVWIEELAAGLLARRFEQVIASHHLGVRKPDEAFYLRLAERVGHAPQEIAFVDDRQSNVDAARSAGMPACHFRGSKALRRWLHDLGISLG